MRFMLSPILSDYDRINTAPSVSIKGMSLIRTALDTRSLSLMVAFSSQDIFVAETQTAYNHFTVYSSIYTSPLSLTRIVLSICNFNIYLYRALYCILHIAHDTFFSLNLLATIRHYFFQRNQFVVVVDIYISRIIYISFIHSFIH